MPQTNTPLPFGLRDVKVASLSTSGVRGTLVDLPNARTFSFSEAEDFEDLRGDDQLVAIRGMGANVEWELEAGGISFEAICVINGGSITETGTTPAQKKVYRKLVTDQRPYFYVEGQALSDSGGDFHAVVYRCKADDSVEGEMADGSFWLTSASGRGLASQAAATIGALYDFVQNESVTAIS